jgi:hypothetical protein
MKPVNSPRNYGQLAVIESGISAGDRVIVDGQVRVVPNNKVTITKTVPIPQATGNPTQSNGSAALTGEQSQ